MNDDRSLFETVTNILQTLPHFSLRREGAEAKRSDHGTDTAVYATIQGRPIHLFIEAKRTGHPRDVRETAWHMRRIQSEDTGTPTVPFLIAPTLSDASKRLLREEGIAYCDRGGSLYLETPWALYYIDRPPMRQERNVLPNIYRGRRTQVLHVLLAHPDQEWHITTLAEAAAVAVSTAHEVLEMLEKELWVERRGRGPSAVRILREPGALLDAWAQRHSLKDYMPRSYYRFAPTSDRLRTDVTRILEEHGVAYALTLASGAELTAPYLTHVDQLSLLIPQKTSLAKITETAGLAPVEEGANIAIYLCREQGPLLFRHQVNGIWVASDIQLYLDLYASPGRGREQAVHLRRQRLAF